MAIKELQTRIALKYDSYTAWTTSPGKDLKLLKGEVGICEIPAINADSNVAPTVLFKVGDGEKTFEALPWVSAKAADVYNWAKSETVVLDGTSLKFKTGTTVNHTVDLSSFATDVEVTAIKNSIEARLTDIESSLGNGDAITEQISGLDERLDTLEGTGDGSVSKALADAKAYTDTREVEIKKYADQAEADAISTANSYTDGKVADLNTKDAALTQEDTRLAGLIGNNTQAISDEATARADADTAINEKIGGNYSKASTVADAIADAKKAGTDAQSAVNALTSADGAVTKNTSDIATLTGNLSTETEARTNADSALSERLDKVEAFFEAADHDGEDGGLTDALDTLAEIQNYLNGEGSAADGIIKDIADNAEAIEDLQTIVSAKDTGLVDQVKANDSEIAALVGRVNTTETNIQTLQAITAGYTESATIKAAIEAADAKAAKGVADAKTAQDAVDALGTKVNDASTGLAATNKLAKDNEAGISGLTTRMTTAESDIGALEDVVINGANANETLRSDITKLVTLTSDASKGNEKLRTDLNTVTNKVDDTSTGLAATNKLANDNAAAIEAIQADYLKAADTFILDCGSSTQVTHTN